MSRVRSAARQEQFLEVVSAEEAHVRFERHLDLTPLNAETVVLAAARTRVLAHDVVAAVDAPPFDRSIVDGFAVRAADTVGASDGNPKTLTLNQSYRLRSCLPHRSWRNMQQLLPGSYPRGADAVAMIEQTDWSKRRTAY